MNNNINPLKLLQLKGAWDQFTGRHPKFPSFLKALSQGAVAEGTVLEFTVTTPDGRVLNSNLKITAEDMALVEQLKNIAK